MAVVINEFEVEAGQESGNASGQSAGQKDAQKPDAHETENLMRRQTMRAARVWAH